MANEVLQKTGTPIVWADSTDFNGTDFTRTHQVDLTSLATAKARQGAKADLGEKRAREYAVFAAFEWVTAPTAGTSVDIYWSSSNSGTAASGNSGGASGADEAYKDSEEAEWLKQLMYLGSLTATNDATTVVQKQFIGFFVPPARYGQIVVHNNATGQAFEDDAVEMYVALIPIVDEVQ